MGADLIGYICLGPKHIGGESMRKAADKAWLVFRDLQSWWLASQTNPDAKPSKEASDALKLAQIDEPSWLECLDFGDGKGIKDTTQEDIEKLVWEISRFWNDPDKCDTVCREISKAEKVVFCGEMSWGEEPSGYGYALTKMAHVLGIVDELGIH